MEPNKHHREKGCLVAASLFSGLIVAIILASFLGWFAVPIGIAFAFLYVAVAAGAVEAILELRSWAHCNKVEKPGDEIILVLGAVWPVALLAGGIVYCFIGIINRSF